MKIRNTCYIAALMSVLSLSAQAETFDTTFGSGGRMLLASTATHYTAIAALPMPNGEILQVLSTTTYATCPDQTCIALARYSAAGVLLGSSVKTLGLSSVDAAALDNSGRIVVVGSIASASHGADIAVARFNANLSADTNFSGDGLATFDILGGNDYAKAVAIDRQDNIVVAGSTFLSATDSDFLVMRVRSSAALDTTFGNLGIAKTAFDLGSVALDQANAVAIGNDGNIIVGGVALDSNIGRLRVAIARLLPGGTLDATFCAGGCSTNGGYTTINNGRTIYYFGSNTGHADELFGIDTLSDGGFAIAGATYANDGSSRRGAVTRFASDGSYRNESVQAGLGGNASFRSVRSADATGTRLLVSGTSGPGDVFLLLQAFNFSVAPLANYGSGNCVPDNSSFCFSIGNGFGDVGPDTAGTVNLDGNGRPLFSASGIASGGNTTTSLVVARFTNSTGPKPDRIFRNGFN